MRPFQSGKIAIVAKIMERSERIFKETKAGTLETITIKIKIRLGAVVSCRLCSESTDQVDPKYDERSVYGVTICTVSWCPMPFLSEQGTRNVLCRV